MRLAVVDQLPIILAGHGVQVTPAQETDVVRFDELVNGVGIAIELFVVHANSTLVL